VRLGLLLALTVLVASAASPAIAKEVTVALDELEPSFDVRDRPYTLRSPGGELPLVVTGISIDRVLDRAGVDPFGYDGATVELGDRSVTLTRDQLTDTDAFPEGRPVFFTDAQGSHFLRPVTGPGDDNAGDLLSGDGEFTIRLAERGQLRVTATASRTRIEAGQRVTFTANVEGADGDVAVRWTFDDGESASGARVRHRFDEPGTYKVIVGATTPADPAGASDIVTVRVGEPPPGPDREGGGTNDEEDAPDSGVATGAASEGGDDDGAEGGSGGREERRPARRRKEPKPEPEPEPEAESGDEVEGVLIAPLDSLPPATAAAARTGNPAPAAVAGELDLPPELLVALAALAMLAYGAWRERDARLSRP
jgi:hypothetical protein